jgi:hypothetical protein
MDFSDFERLGDAVKRLHLKTRNEAGLFAVCPEITPSEHLEQALRRGAPLASAIGTEKARSELIVAPVLLELKALAPETSFFSGIDFTVDVASGLNGVCDFLISRAPEQFMLSAPVVALVEAKRDDIHEGLGQCVAEMVAAQLYNQREGQSVAAVYGAVTTGSIWTFLRLTEMTLTIDLEEYMLARPGRILGVLLAMATGSAPV